MHARILIQVYTGHLVAVVNQHYQVVNVLRFTDDGTYLLSGGADARVLVWKFSRLDLRMNITLEFKKGILQA